MKNNSQMIGRLLNYNYTCTENKDLNMLYSFEYHHGHHLLQKR